jgi:hypothetical protein
MNNVRIAASLAVAIGLALAPSLALAGDSAKVRVDFAKCFPNPPLPLPPGIVFINIGEVTGDVTGPLAVYGQPGSFASMGGSSVYLEADYEVTATDPAKSFTARVGGRFDLGIGRAVLYGFVSEGWMTGAQVVDEFHATTPGCVAGTLVITPRWSHPADTE